MPYAFLSNDWLDAIEALRPEWPTPPAEVEGVLINLIVKGGPDGDVEVHTKSGFVDRGLDPAAPTTVTVPYDVARQLYVHNDSEQVMAALGSGDLTIEGDASQVMTFLSVEGEATAEQIAFQSKVQAFTA
jgi:hypothetical protein